MKKSTYALFIFIITSVLNAQDQMGCLPDGITFDSQEMIDDFPVYLPQCTTIGGDVIIEGEITNLDGLSQLRFIEGGLEIQMSFLSDLVGLDNLISIGGDLKIKANDQLSSLNGLTALKFIGGGLEISHNYSLTDLSGLDDLLSISGQFRVSDNNSLASLDGFELINYQSITELSIAGNMMLSSCGSSSICSYLANPSGPVNIYMNADGFNNPAEAAQSCGTSIPCLPFGNYYFFNQDDVDEFPANYTACSNINGNVEIKGSEISDLGNLSQITSIEGSLTINSTFLTSLNGLDNLTYVGQDFIISENDTLQSISSLNALTSIGGNFELGYYEIHCNQLYLYGNPALSSLNGCDNLQTIGGDLSLYGNHSIVDLSGFGSLSSIGNDLNIWGNNGLTTLQGLEQLSVIPGSLNFRTGVFQNMGGLNNVSYIAGNVFLQSTAIQNMEGMDALDAIGGSLYIYFNPSLKDFSGLEGLSSIGGNMEIGNNNLIQDFTGFHGLNSIGGVFFVWHNDSLKELHGIDNLNSIGDSLIMHHNDALTDLSGLDNLTFIDGSLSLLYNTCLKDLSALNNLNAINGKFSISFNDSLTAIEGFDNLDPNSITNLEIRGNNSLTTNGSNCICSYLSNPTGPVNIYNNNSGFNTPSEVASQCGFTMSCLPFGNYYFSTQEEVDNFQTNYPGCDTLMGNVTIDDGVDNLLGLLQVVGIQRSLYVRSYLLDNLNGLNNLEYIGEDLSILSCDSLQSLNGLDNLNKIEGDLYIGYNPNLSYCAVQGICDYLQSPGGYISIMYNQSGCNSRQEVEEACMSVYIDAIDKAIESDFKVFPNPVFDHVKISADRFSSSQITISVYDVTGNSVFHEYFHVDPDSFQEIHLDLHSLAQGMYVIRMQTGKEVISKKIIKQ